MKLSIKYCKDEPRVAVTGLVNVDGEVRYVENWIPNGENKPMTFDPNALVEPKYVGIPWKRLGRTFEGVDCIGICWLYLTQNGFKVPDTDGLPIPKDWKKSDAERMIRETLKIGDLAPLTKLQKFDIVLFVLSGNIRSTPDHMAVMVSGSCFLHVTENNSTEVQQITQFWKSRMTGAVRITNKRIYLPEDAEVRVKL